MGEFIIWWLAGSLFVFIGNIIYNRYIANKDSDVLDIGIIMLFSAFGPVTIALFMILMILIICITIFIEIGDKINGTPVYDWLLGRDRRYGKTK